MVDQLFDKEWRMSHLYKIKNKQKELIRFKPNKVQAHFNQNKHTRNIVLKSRQLGMTTFEAVDMLDDALFENIDGLFIAQDLDTAQDIFDNKVSLLWSNFDFKGLYKIDADSARRLKFDHGNKTYSSITVDTTGRSGTYNRLHITEFAKVCRNFPSKAREIIEGSIPAVPTTGRVDIESTADGSDGFFYDMFWEAWERGDPTHPTEFKAHFYNWIWDEEVDKTESIASLPTDFTAYQIRHSLTLQQISFYYLKWLSLNKDWNALRKEYPTTPHEAFLSSGNKLFDSLKIDKLDIKTGEKAGDWIYYEDWDVRHNYALGADVAEGVGQDSSTCIIWDFTPIKPKVVAEYKNNKITADLFAYEIKAGGQRYGTCLVAPERNNHGHATLVKLKEIYPENKIYRDPTGKLGWQTNLISKPKMMFELNTAVNDELVDIPSRVLASEMRRYDREELDTTRFDDDSTRHSDLLIAAAIGFQMKNNMDKEREEAHIFIPSDLRR